MKHLLLYIFLLISFAAFSQNPHANKTKVKQVKNKDSVLIEFIWDTLILVKPDTITDKKNVDKKNNTYEQWYQTAIPIINRNYQLVGYKGSRWQRRYVKKPK